MKIITERENITTDKNGIPHYSYRAYFKDCPNIYYESRTENQAVRRLLEFSGHLKGIELHKKWKR